MSLAIFCAPVPVGTLWCYSGDYSAAIVELVVHRTTVGYLLGQWTGQKKLQRVTNSHFELDALVLYE